MCKYCPDPRGIPFIQADPVPVSKATFPLISEAALDFSAWKGSRFNFSKGCRTVAGLPSLQRKQTPSSSRQCPYEGVRGDKDTQNLWARADFVEKNFPIPYWSSLSSQIRACTNTPSPQHPHPPRPGGWLPFPNQFLLQGYNKVFLKFY